MFSILTLVCFDYICTAHACVLIAGFKTALGRSCLIGVCIALKKMEKTCSAHTLNTSPYFTTLAACKVYHVIASKLLFKMSDIFLRDN